MKLKQRQKGLRDIGGHRPEAIPPIPQNIERLVSCAILRGGQTYKGYRSHYNLRASLDDDRPERGMTGDIEGFWTNQGRYVNRYEAQDIALLAGQISRKTTRELLSSDINWDR